jgi:transposase
LLERLNNRPFRKREGTRASLFAAIDRPVLRPLPAQRYITADWRTVRASIDYHVEVDRHYYSVPYQLAGSQMEARFTSRTVEIFDDRKRVASHMRSFTPHLHTTITEHMPKSHQAHMEWTPSRLIHWAGTVGEATALVIGTVLETNGIRRSVTAPVSASCVSARPTRTSVWRRPASVRSRWGACSYQSLKSILKRSLDRQAALPLEPERSGARHENVRGAQYFDPPTSLLL